MIFISITTVFVQWKKCIRGVLMDGKKDTMAVEYPTTFTGEFVRYCRSYHLPPSLFHDLGEMLEKVPRYVRVRPSHLSAIAAASGAQVNGDWTEVWRVRSGIADSFNLPPEKVEEVDWLPHLYCFSIPRGVAMSRSALYRMGALSAMDAASVAAVVALRPCRGELVWDVCCSPGMKLSLIADAIGDAGAVVGTDISLERLFSTRSVLKKHKADNVCLFASDATCFSLQGAASAFDEDISPRKIGGDGLTAWEKRRLSKRRSVGVTTVSSSQLGGADKVEMATLVFASENARRLFGNEENLKNGFRGFDRVLVDAECSHDGSLAHIFLNNTSRKPFSSDAITPVVITGIDNAHRMRRLNLDSEDTGGHSQNGSKLSPLLRIQLGLLKNGYAQLKPGGTLVYCTCSFTYEQNEFIVQEMLRLVNASDEAKSRYQGEAVICHPFSYSHDQACTKVASPILDLNDTQVTFLRQRLETATDPYGIFAARGVEEKCSANFVGVRFWPYLFSTSFQFISKIWKRPLQSSSGAKEQE